MLKEIKNFVPFFLFCLSMLQTLLAFPISPSSSTSFTTQFKSPRETFPQFTTLEILHCDPFMTPQSSLHIWICWVLCITCWNFLLFAFCEIEFIALFLFPFENVICILGDVPVHKRIEMFTCMLSPMKPKCIWFHRYRRPKFVQHCSFVVLLCSIFRLPLQPAQFSINKSKPISMDYMLVQQTG